MFMTILTGMIMCAAVGLTYAALVLVLIAVTDNPRHALRLMIGVCIVLGICYAVGWVGERWLL